MSIVCHYRFTMRVAEQRIEVQECDATGVQLRNKKPGSQKMFLFTNRYTLLLYELHFHYSLGHYHKLISTSLSQFDLSVNFRGIRRTISGCCFLSKLPES